MIFARQIGLKYNVSALMNSDIKKVIIYDSDHPGAKLNRCFSPQYALQGIGHDFTVKLAERVKEKGWDIMTSDVFLQSATSQNLRALCVTDMISGNTKDVIGAGAVPFVCLCTESPLIAKDFYSNIQKYAGHYIYNIQFRGVQERLISTKTVFEPMYFPMANRRARQGVDWSKRKLLVLINRNKRAFFFDYSSAKGLFRTILSFLKLTVSKYRDPWIRSREIYKDRLNAILHFSKTDGFDLYGEGWERKIPGFSQEYQRAALHAYQGQLSFEQKLPTMSRYKFALCFENCSFPGYVTEKIFDCFLAGCIPIYYGAPDIGDFVPRDTFIDFREFNSYADLEKYITNFSSQEAQCMLSAARAFLEGPSFDKFYLDNIVDKLVSKMDAYFRENLSS